MILGLTEGVSGAKACGNTGGAGRLLLARVLRTAGLALAAAGSAASGGKPESSPD